MNPLDSPEKSNIAVSTRPTGIKWGMYGGLAAVAIGLLMYLSGSMFPNPESGSTVGSTVFGCGSFILTCVLIVMALNEYKKQNNYLEIGDSVSLGFWYGLVSGAIGVVWTLLLTNLIEPDFYAKMSQAMMQTYEKAGMSEEQITQTMENPMVKIFQSPTSALLMQLIGGPIFGVIIAAIAGLFIKKPRNSYS
jgi:Protein of unknown function (DUF4199)